MSLMQATLGISYGSGLLFIGIIGDTWNMHGAFMVGAVVGITGFGLLTLRAKNWRRAIDGNEVLPQPELARC